MWPEEACVFVLEFSHKAAASFSALLTKEMAEAAGVKRSEKRCTFK